MRIRYKMYLLVGLQLALLVLALVYYSSVMEREMLQRLTAYNSQLNQHNLPALRDALNEMKNICSTTLNLENPSVNRETELLFKQLNAYRDINLTFRNNTKLWTRYLRDIPYLKRIQMSSIEGPAVFMDKGSDVFFITIVDPTLGWVTETMQRRGDYCVSRDGEQLVLSRAIINPLKYDKLGVIAIYADPAFLKEHFEHNRLFLNQRYWLFVDGVAAVGDADMPYESALAVAEAPTPYESIRIDRQHGKVYVYQRTDGPNQILSMTEIPYDAIYGQVFWGNLSALLLVALYVLGSFVIVTMIVRSIFSSLKVFEGAFGRIERGEFGQTVDVPMEGELRAFLGAFNRMSVRLKQLIGEVYEKNLMQHKLELQMLRSQINPHFFYNTLEALRMNSMMRREEQNVQMIEHLSAILRYGVAPGTEPVRLSDELAQLENYVKLHNLRSDAQIVLRVFLPPELLQQRTIRLLLQPLVENSIQHALPEDTELLEICISGYRDGDEVVLSVADDGNGIPQDGAESLNRQLRGEPGDVLMGIGLKNVNRRLQLFYGEGYGLEVRSRPMRGTEVLIRMPYVHEADAQKEDAPCA